MRVHVVYAHPVAQSFNAALHDCIVTTLRSAGHAVDDLDLYAEGFDPVLSMAERIRYQTADGNLAGTEAYVRRLRAAEAFVVCAPSWWSGMPAILKGYFDRVWVPGVAFELGGNGSGVRPLLTNIRKFVVVTTHGSPHWFVTLVMRNPGKVVLMRGIRPLLAPRARRIYLALYSMDNASAAARARFVARVQRTFAAF